MKFIKIVDIIMLCIIILHIFLGCIPKREEEPKKEQGKEYEVVNEAENEDEQKEEEQLVDGDIELQGEFLGADYSNVDFIILSLDEISIYYDLMQDYQMKFAVNMAEAFTKSSNIISSMEEKERIALNERGYVEVKPEHYYLEIQFKESQKVELGGENYFDCDDILIDLTDRIIYVRLEAEYVGILNYKEESLQSIYNQVKSVVDSISQNLISDVTPIPE